MDSDDARPARTLAPNGIHLVRTSQQMQLQLSQMADQKASMLMGATFVVFTLAVGQVRAGAMTVPIIILAISAFVSAILSVLTVLPKTHVHDGPVREDDNLLFFGIFTAMDERVWADMIIDQLEQDETICRTMLRDLYQNGQVLQRKKYKYLGYAYRIFLAGLGLTFVAFVTELVTGRYV